MSHLRDIQKLRQSRNPNSQYIFAHRFSQPTGHPLQKGVFNLQQLGMTENMASTNSQTHHSHRQDQYGKFLQSKEILPRTRERKTSHKRGLSNGATFYQKREPELLGNQAFSIFNMSVKSSMRTPNPLTSRRQKKQEFLVFESAFDLKDKNSVQLQQIPSKLISSGRNSSKSLRQGEVNRSDFEIMYPIGKGGFGKVWKVQQKKNKQVYALKEMYKAKIISKKSINSVMNERKILAKLHHPFIINMSYAFQDRENLYLLLDYLDGGDLRYHICKRGRFTELETKFFMANLLIGLEYMHRNNIIHRDIKPENLVLDSKGYLRITDMGISRELKPQNSQDTSGTPGYMAPEVMVRKNHGFPVDYFALGVMGYEFMLGKRPYQGRNRSQVRDQILAKQAGIRKQDLPRRWSIEAADFINKLLIRNPLNRLGYHGILQIKEHPWFDGIDWVRLEKKQVKAPYIPISIEDDYEEYKEQISEDSVDDNLEDNMLMLRDKEVQSLFEGYQFEKHQIKLRSTSYTTTCTESEIKEVRKSRQLRDQRDNYHPFQKREHFNLKG